MQSSTTPLEITYHPTTTLKPDPRNPRVHTDKQVRQIAQSIESFGFNVPLLIDDQQKVIAGHGRLLAACKMGWETVPAIKLSHLCDFTSPSKRDIELLSISIQKRNCRCCVQRIREQVGDSRGERDSLIARRLAFFRPNAAY
jgi:hypothetical protein